MKYERHPASTLFPVMSGTELDGLVEDIKKNGLLEPIVLHQGKVLDGRNRLLACERAKVKPKFVDWDGDDFSPILYVLSKNLHRRHLTTSQRAAIAAKSLPMLQQEAKQRQAHGLTAPGKTLPAVLPEAFSGNEISKLKTKTGDTRDMAGQAVAVSGSTVQHALAVKEADPKEFERIEKGETTVEEAYRKIKKQRVSKHLERRGKAAKRRMFEALASVRGFCRGLNELKIEFLHAQCGNKELKFWSEDAFRSAKALRVFGKNLRRKP